MTWCVVERLPDGRERTLGTDLSLEEAKVVFFSDVTWAGEIRHAPEPDQGGE